MSLSKKHFIKIAEIINSNFKWHKDENGNYTNYIDTKIINDLSSYFWNESLEKYKNSKVSAASGYLFDKIKFINASIPKFTVLNKKELKYLSVFDEQKGGK